MTDNEVLSSLHGLFLARHTTIPSLLFQSLPFYVYRPLFPRIFCCAKCQLYGMHSQTGCEWSTNMTTTTFTGKQFTMCVCVRCEKVERSKNSVRDGIANCDPGWRENYYHLEQNHLFKLCTVDKSNEKLFTFDRLKSKMHGLVTTVMSTKRGDVSRSNIF